MTADCVAIVLGRKGSKGIPSKNTMILGGHPISHYPIVAAMESKYVTDIFLSTDDDIIINQTEKYSPKVIRRPHHLCTDDALFEDALSHAYYEIIDRLGRVPDIFVVLMCNAATINAPLIDAAIDTLNQDHEADSAVTVTKLNMYSPLRARKLDESGYLKPFVPFDCIGDEGDLSCDRDSQGDVYFADMSHSVVRSRAIKDIDYGLLPQRWMGKKIVPIYNSFGCDIDADWQIAATQWWLNDKGLC